MNCQQQAPTLSLAQAEPPPFAPRVRFGLLSVSTLSAFLGAA
jgi:hypothetical protein